MLCTKLHMINLCNLNNSNNIIHPILPIRKLPLREVNLPKITQWISGRIRIQTKIYLISAFTQPYRDLEKRVGEGGRCRWMLVREGLWVRTESLPALVPLQGQGSEPWHCFQMPTALAMPASCHCITQRQGVVPTW